MNRSDLMEQFGLSVNQASADLNRSIGFARGPRHDGAPFVWDEDRRANLRTDLDAFYARAFDLTGDELRYILDSADVKGPGCPRKPSASSRKMKTTLADSFSQPGAAWKPTMNSRLWECSG